MYWCSCKLPKLYCWERVLCRRALLSLGKKLFTCMIPICSRCVYCFQLCNIPLSVFCIRFQIRRLLLPVTVSMFLLQLEVTTLAEKAVNNPKYPLHPGLFVLIVMFITFRLGVATRLMMLIWLIMFHSLELVSIYKSYERRTSGVMEISDDNLSVYSLQICKNSARDRDSGAAGCLCA
jgi:hypothetical protein